MSSKLINQTNTGESLKKYWNAILRPKAALKPGTQFAAEGRIRNGTPFLRPKAALEPGTLFFYRKLLKHLVFYNFLGINNKSYMYIYSNFDIILYL